MRLPRTLTVKPSSLNSRFVVHPLFLSQQKAVARSARPIAAASSRRKSFFSSRKAAEAAATAAAAAAAAATTTRIMAPNSPLVHTTIPVPIMPPPPPMIKPIISPSLLSCDLARMADEGRQMINMGADWLHLDIMDGHFVPNLSFGPPVVLSLHKALPNAFLDCHLMVSEPEHWIEPLRQAGVSSVTFHVESTLPNNSVEEMIHRIRNNITHHTDDSAHAHKNDNIRARKMQVGLAIKPATPIESIFPYLDQIGLVDLVLVMTVEPGFSGQSFMFGMLPKISALRQRYPHLLIQVDGGLAPGTTVECASHAGANVIVSASAIFKENNSAEDRAATIQTLRSVVQTHLSNRHAQSHPLSQNS